jgi:hypothetical protein
VSAAPASFSATGNTNTASMATSSGVGTAASGTNSTATSSFTNVSSTTGTSVAVSSGVSSGVSSEVSSAATSIISNTTATTVALPNTTTSIVYTATDYVADPYQNSLNTFTLDVQLGSSNASVPLLVSYQVEPPLNPDRHGLVYGVGGSYELPDLHGCANGHGTDCEWQLH